MEGERLLNFFIPIFSACAKTKTRMRKLIFAVLLLIVVQQASSQNYIDLVKINYGSFLGSGFENSDADQSIDQFDLQVTIPIPISKKTAIITGIDYFTAGVNFFPDGETQSLRTAVFKLGLNLTHSDKWGGIYLFQPKISSRGLITSSDAFFFGGLGLLTYKATDRLTWRFGVIGSSEAFGALVSPIFGLYYLSKNQKWEIDAFLPGLGKVNYQFRENTSIGFAFQGMVKSFALDQDTNPLLFAESASIELGPFIEQSFFKKMIRLRLQAGYSTVQYQLFNADDLLPFRLSGIEFGDDRTVLNPGMDGAFFVRVGMTFRLFLNNAQNNNKS